MSKFKIISLDELLSRLDKYPYRECHIHHTWKPAHSSFNGRNHIQLQENMRNFHVNTRGWSDIAQHISIMPDGLIVTGRDLGVSPASMTGHNQGAFCIENIGNFDIKGTGNYNELGYDKLYGKQRDTLLKIIKYFVDRLGDKSIVFHRERSGKTCPGTSLNKQVLISEAKGVDISMNRTVREGSRGDHVRELQSNLSSLDFDTGTIDGIAGDKTINAIKSFQRSNGLDDDGIFGTRSYDALEKALKDPGDHWAKKYYDSLKAAGIKITETRFDDKATRGEVFSLLTQVLDIDIKEDPGAEKKPYEIIHPDNQTTVVKIRKDTIEEVDVVTAATHNNRELLESMKIRKNLDFIISGGLWWNDRKGKSHSLNLLIDEGKQIQAGVYSRFGLKTFKNGNFRFGDYAWTPTLKDMIGGSPALVQGGRIKIDTGAMKGSIINSRHPRAGVGDDKDHFYLVTIDGRQEGKRGATIREFASRAIDLGCENFICGDGGGTVRLESRNAVLNSPTENRASNNAIGIRLK